jgi:putative type I pili usher protein csuD
MKEGRNRFTVTLPENGGTCTFEADYPETHNPDSIPELGDIICR